MDGNLDLDDFFLLLLLFFISGPQNSDITPADQSGIFILIRERNLPEISASFGNWQAAFFFTTYTKLTPDSLLAAAFNHRRRLIIQLPSMMDPDGYDSSSYRCFIYLDGFFICFFFFFPFDVSHGAVWRREM